LKTFEKIDLMLFVLAGDEDEELASEMDGWRRGRAELSEGCAGGFRGFLPGGLEFSARGWSDVQEALVELGLGFGKGGQRVDTQKEFARFFFRDIEDLDLDFHVGVEVAAEVAIDQFEPAVGEFEGQQGTGETDFFI